MDCKCSKIFFRIESVFGRGIFSFERGNFFPWKIRRYLFLSNSFFVSLSLPLSPLPNTNDWIELKTVSSCPVETYSCRTNQYFRMWGKHLITFMFRWVEFSINVFSLLLFFFFRLWDLNSFPSLSLSLLKKGSPSREQFECESSFNHPSSSPWMKPALKWWWLPDLLSQLNHSSPSFLNIFSNSAGSSLSSLSIFLSLPLWEKIQWIPYSVFLNTFISVPFRRDLYIICLIG